MPGSFDRGLGKTVDWWLVGCYFLLVLIGWVVIYASIHSTEPSSIFDWSARSGKQAIWILTAVLLDVFILFVINPRLWEVLSPYAYIAVFLLLVLVIFVSKDVKGSHSWFELGPVKFQPAEISKITTSLLLAMVMSKPTFRLSNRKHFLAVAAIVGLPMLAILGESETGSALVYVGFIFPLYREGLSGWWLFMLGMSILLFILTLVTSWWVSAAVLFGVCLIYMIQVLRTSRREERSLRRRAFSHTLLAFFAGVMVIFATDFVFDHVLQDHQRKRIEVLLGLKEDPAGVGYNVRQSMIAIGSGGFSGKGFLQGTQTTYGFVPEQSTDFIFCTVGEEWGFLGCLVVIMLYVFLIWRILNNAEQSREAFTRIYGYCLASCLFMHLFINISMTIGLMPVIGIPLPLLSYGGSSLWAFSMMLFIFIALDRQEKKYF
ncbi:MAG: rod shape-determining protein RodA [Bacteroidales bacterium]|nr:rod shape-determining protein RodA [Bacteroidales bacterium]MBR6876308.1 rod shape-determining protein RodA [Bacteroidales bacterium]